MLSDQGAAGAIALARTLLFVPGDRPERFPKAAASGADLVIVDLEDAVEPARKNAARDAAKTWLSGQGKALVRINAANTEWFDSDLALANAAGLLGFVHPKAIFDQALQRVSRTKPTIALVESAEGIGEIDAIARTPGVVRLAFGTIDLALDLDITCDSLLLELGTGLVLGSRRAGLAAPIDGVSPGFANPSSVEGTMLAARARGFTGKLCIHPAQIAPVHRALSPKADEIEKAKNIVEAYRAANGAAVAVAGQMVDKPVEARARRLLKQAASEQ